MAKKEGSILIVDDNKDLLLALKMYLQPYFKHIKTEHNPNRIKEHLKASIFDVVVLDMNFTAGINNGNEGLYWMREVHSLDRNIAVVFITGFGDVELAVKAIKEGAADFIEKSWDEAKILSTLLSVFKLQKSKRAIEGLQKKQEHLKKCINGDNTTYLGESKAMQDVIQLVDKVSPTDANVLILGENGTGKEVMARLIHERSDRKGELFVSVDLGAVSESLFESELFGHKKGAFTDAKCDRTGRFELASGGTLFLDEIGNLSLAMQAKLLSALQSREITPLGGTRPVKIDIRLICATNMPLQQMVAEGTFREDLLYRINTITMDIPALRQRKEDIAGLANFFLQSFAAKYHKEGLYLSAKAIDLLKQQGWPGNVRELMHAIEKAVILSDQDCIDVNGLVLNQSAPVSVLVDSLNLADHEKILIEKAIVSCKGNLSQTAKKLGINRSTLYDKIKRYGL